MGQIIRPGSSTSGYDRQSSRPFFVVHILSQYGFRGLVAMVFAAVIAFAPLAALIWFNVFRLTSVVSRQCGVRVVARERTEYQRASDRPGKTGLLQITVEVPTFDGWLKLRHNNDLSPSDPNFVRDERVYLRRAGDLKLPFGLLGRPPISAWVPAGDYEIAVVHETPPDFLMQTGSPGVRFPFVTIYESCTVQNREQTVVNVLLPHYGWGRGTPLYLAGQMGAPSDQPPPDLKRLFKSIAKSKAIPTPGGYVLLFAEPVVTHTEEHQRCTVDFDELQQVPREWTRNQLAMLRNWLPPGETAARDKLSPLVTNLMRREMFEGWFFYAMAGIAGLVLTNWGSIAILERWRRREMFSNTVWLCFWIFVISAVGWWFVGNS